jgi:hypothetical protein
MVRIGKTVSNSVYGGEEARCDKTLHPGRRRLCFLATAAVLAVVAGLYFMSYYLTHATSSVILNINSGEVSIEIQKGGHGVFNLVTVTSTAHLLGYTLSAFGSMPNSDITIEKCNDENCTTTVLLSADPVSPIEVDVTSGPVVEKTTSVKYRATVAQGAVDGPYNVTIAYHLVENKPFVPTTFADFTPDYCYNRMTTGDIIALRDTRNNQQYRVKKMEDSQCWMIDNLKLANVNITNADSDVNADFTIPDLDAPYNSSDIDTTIYVNDPRNMPGYSDYCNGDVFSENPATKTGCGYLYSWPTVIAGTGASNMTSGDATSSICPVNFRLPTGNSAGDFAYLNAHMAGITPPSTDPSYYDGWMSDGSWQGVLAGLSTVPMYQGAMGVYWSSTVESYNSVYYIFFHPGMVMLDSYTSMLEGAAVRCVARA